MGGGKGKSKGEMGWLGGLAGKKDEDAAIGGAPLKCGAEGKVDEVNWGQKGDKE